MHLAGVHHLPLGGGLHGLQRLPPTHLLKLLLNLCLKTNGGDAHGVSSTLYDYDALPHSFGNFGHYRFQD